MTDAAAATLVLILTLLAGHDPEHARDLARQTLVRTGCADVRVEMEGPRQRGPLQLRAHCKRLGPPVPGTPEGSAATVTP